MLRASRLLHPLSLARLVGSQQVATRSPSAEIKKASNSPSSGKRAGRGLSHCQQPQSMAFEPSEHMSSNKSPCVRQVSELIHLAWLFAGGFGS